MNELILSNDLKEIEDEIDLFSHRTQRALWELGRRFKHVKENDLAHGKFMEWYQRKGFNKNFVADAIKVAEEFPNFPTLGNFKSESALKIASRLPEEARREEHVTSNGETKTVNEMTVRELQEVKLTNLESYQLRLTARHKEIAIINNDDIKEFL